jgi:hypothetical protein
MSDGIRTPVLRRPGRDKEEKLREFFRYMKNLQEQRFTGYVKVNFSQGSLSRIEKFEEILKD